MSSEPRHQLLTTLKQTAAPRCPRCGAPVRCGIAEGKSQCWCFSEPAVMRVPTDGGGCLCRDCLRAAIAAQEQTPLTTDDTKTEHTVAGEGEWQP